MSFEVDRRTGIKFRRVMKVGITIGMMIAGAIMAVILLITVLVTNSSHNKEVAKLEDKIVELQKKKDREEGNIMPPEEVLTAEDDDWMLALINGSNPLDQEYVPELVELTKDMYVDERIVDAAKEMLAAAKKDDMDMIVCSAYRSHETQEQIFNDTMKGWLDEEYSYLDAYAKTNLSVMIPGCSEHAAGIALDIVSASYTNLDEKQADTAEAKWLEEHCWEYGFILRYPPEKSDITGIIYEPWHYRYVGKEAAKEIMEQGVTLEEYLGAF
ncbi:MAG: M15 family metallopeptidase [Schaedlerella sp.]|nr:M15 family metallopeptidase [Schaedlerella sp.]